MNSAAEWVASIPDQLTAREGLVYVETALRDADEATKEIVARFSGTLPPPPWPKHPELETAIKTMEGGRLMLNQAIQLGHGDTKQPKNGPTGLRLQSAGRNLYREIAVMQKNLRGVKPEDVPGLLLQKAKPLLNIGGATAFWLGVGWLAWRILQDERGRGRRRVFE